MNDELIGSVDIQDFELQSKRYRLSARNLFLTYSRCPESWTMEYVRDTLKGLLVHQKGESKYQTKVKACVVAEEHHKEPVGSGDYQRGEKHYHCVIVCDRKLDIRNADFFDIDGIHGNYQRVRNIFRTLNYVKKHGKWISEGFVGVSEKGRNVLEAVTEGDAKMMLFDQMRPSEKLKVREEMIEVKKKKTVTEEIVAKIPVYAFHEVLKPFGMEAGIGKIGRALGLLMSGESESGKTSLATVIGEELGYEVMTIRDPRELSEHYRKEPVILWDEISEKEFKENGQFLTQLVTERDVKSPRYYGTKRIEWPRKVLLATNEDVTKWGEESWTEGLRSRFLVVRTYKDGKFQFLKWEGKELKEMSVEEVKKILGNSSEPSTE